MTVLIGMTKQFESKAIFMSRITIQNELRYEPQPSSYEDNESDLEKLGIISFYLEIFLSLLLRLLVI